MRVSRYRLVLCLQLLLLAIDLFVNSFSGLFASEDVVLLVMYIVQDANLVFEMIILFLLFFNTYVFRAGLVKLLVRKFKTAIAFCLIYLLLCLAFHAWSLKEQWGKKNAFVWEGGVQALYVLQRFASFIYYYMYMRTAWKLGDPMYYRNSQWLQTEFTRK
jgi:hypothetical protein